MKAITQLVVSPSGTIGTNPREAQESEVENGSEPMEQWHALSAQPKNSSATSTSVEPGTKGKEVEENKHPRKSSKRMKTSLRNPNENGPNFFC